MARSKKGAKPTPGLVKAHDNSAPGRTPNADLTDYTPPMVLDDLDKIKSRIRKATYNGRDLNQLAKVFTVEALTVIVQCINDAECNMADRLRASELLLNRGWGRAKETVDINNNTSITVSAPDIMALINARRQQTASVVDVADVKLI